MSKRITQEEFLKRFYTSFPAANITVLKYTAISNPAKIKCNKCGKIHEKKAQYLIANFSCCEILKNKTKFDKITEIYKNSSNYHLIKRLDKDNVIVHCNKCGNDIKRNIQACLNSPFACSHCNTIKIKNMLTIEEIQKRVNEAFFYSIQVLEYNGIEGKNSYKCLKCGLIFKTNQTSLMASRGCPKCDRWKSKGETFMVNYLTERNIKFKEQVKVKELHQQKFDFGIYDSNDNLICFIEVHFEERPAFRDSLEKIQERDARKRSYCQKNNIPLYELIYLKGKFKNLDILPF